MSPNQEKTAAITHHIAACPNRRSMASVNSELTTSTRNKNPLARPCTDDQ